jgi:hypothetical protein
LRENDRASAPSIARHPNQIKPEKKDRRRSIGNAFAAVDFRPVLTARNKGEMGGNTPRFAMPNLTLDGVFYLAHRGEKGAENHMYFR